MIQTATSLPALARMNNSGHRQHHWLPSGQNSQSYCFITTAALILVAEYESSTLKISKKDPPNKALSQFYPLSHPHKHSASFSK